MAQRGAIAAADEVRFGLLGPLRVTNGSVASGQVTAAKQRTVLAALLLSRGHVVSPDALADAVWDTRVPANAAAVMRTYVARLRRALGSAGGRIERRPGGWVLELRGPGEFDVTEVEQLRGQARAAAAAGDWTRASTLLTRALGLWRGEPLADVPSSTLASRERPRLDELRLALAEARIDADLRLGRHNDVCDELRRLTWEQPLREHFHAQLMLAYYGCGQQAAALRVYRDARRILADELAVEPGPELQKLNQQILTADPALVTSPPAVRAAALDDAVPRQVPAAAGHFTGRADELRLLAEAGTLCLITGMPGAGKTALAVHWAHQAAGAFPDGQLYVDLRGFDPREPLSAGEALAGFLRALGVRGADIPDAVDERSSLLRSALSGRRVLILLDNARSADQVRPLLPAGAGCMAIVTSRDALAGLVARDGASRVELGPLPPGQALALLRGLIGERVDADLRSARRLAAGCCGLPLALRVAAEVAIARRDVPLSELADELTERQHALDALEAGGDTRTAVREVLSWSYQQLDSTTARAFRLAGLHPGGSWGSDAGAALIGTTRGDASRALGTLADGHLIERSGADRYRMPALLRSYARDLAHAAGERRAALGRLFGHYLAMAHAASALLHSASQDQARATAGSIAPMTDAPTARAWLDRERAGLTALIQAADICWGREVTELASAVMPCLEAGGFVAEGLTIYTSAERAARLMGDHGARADALIGLGTFRLQQGSHRRAVAVLGEAVAVARGCDDPMSEARALGELGVISRRRGDHRAARDHQLRALTLFGELSRPRHQAMTLSRLANVERDLGDLEQAAARNRQALIVCRETGDRNGQAYALTRLGTIEQRQGDFVLAADHHRQALAIFGAQQDRVGQAEALDHLGAALHRVGQLDPARASYRAAIRLATLTKDRHRENRARQGMARLPA